MGGHDVRPAGDHNQLPPTRTTPNRFGLIDEPVRVIERRFDTAARAAARKLLTLVFYGMRDLEVRCLDIAHPTTEAA